MKDITAEFDRFREASRHLRNAFLPRGDFEAEEWFQRVDRLLFEVLVLRPMVLSAAGPIPSDIYLRLDYSDLIRLVPDSEGSAPVMISRTKEADGYWDCPITALSRDTAEIGFLEVFDWDQVGFREMRYFMGRIDVSPSCPEIVGHRVLIECQSTKVLYRFGGSSHG